MKRPDLIFDVGMHRGEDTDFYLRKGFRVVGFDADPEHVEFCRCRFREFISRGQLTIIEGAIVEPGNVSPGQETISFFKNESVSVWGTVRNDWAERNERLGAVSQVMQAKITDFPAALKEHGVPHYLKVDIEGCDLACIRALEAFSERPDYVSIESSKSSLRKIYEEITLLSKLGYDSFQAVEQSAVPAQVPPHPAKEGRYVAHQFLDGASGLFGSELPGTWKSRALIMRQYRAIRLGYYLLGESGILTRYNGRAWKYLQLWCERMLEQITKASVPGWYDTHARLEDDGSCGR